MLPLTKTSFVPLVIGAHINLKIGDYGVQKCRVLEAVGDTGDVYLVRMVNLKKNTVVIV